MATGASGRRVAGQLHQNLMKIDRAETAPSGKRRLAIYLGDEDLDIIDGLVKSALQYTPQCMATFKTMERMRNMRKNIRDFRKAEEDERAQWALPPENISLSSCKIAAPVA